MKAHAVQAASGEGTFRTTISSTRSQVATGCQILQQQVSRIQTLQTRSLGSCTAACVVRLPRNRRHLNILAATWHVGLRTVAPMAALRSSAQDANTATVDVSESLGSGVGAMDAVVIRAKDSISQKPAPEEARGAQHEAHPDSLRQVAATIAEGIRGRDGSIVRSPVVSVALIGVGLLFVGAGVAAKLRNQEENTVDALARRGFISSDRSVPLELIQGYEDPTRVRDYKIGNAKLVELEPLAPLSEEKLRYHREQRRREHGWKKPEHVLVEGEPIPEGVDPLSVRFIPKKHPFALNSAAGEEEWSEEVARRRLRQRRGRPEKEQQRSREQLDRLRREMQLRDSPAAESGSGAPPDADNAKGKGVGPDMEG